MQSSQPLGPQNIYLPDLGRARSELNLDVGIPLPGPLRGRWGFKEW